jgi:hypothetical protein
MESRPLKAKTPELTFFMFFSFVILNIKSKKSLFDISKFFQELRLIRIKTSRLQDCKTAPPPLKLRRAKTTAPPWQFGVGPSYYIDYRW